MSVVYWCYNNICHDSYEGTKRPILPRSPERISNYVKHFSNSGEGSDFLKCPAFYNLSKCTYNLVSPVNFDIMWTNEGLFSDREDEFIGPLVMQRNLELGVFSLALLPYIFFSEDDVEMIIGNGYFSQSDFSSKTNIISGMFNISKWFRPIDLSFIVKNKNDPILIREFDVLSSCTFLCKDHSKVELKQFQISDKLKEFYGQCYNHRMFVNSLKHYKISEYFDKFYDAFVRSNIKKSILKEINNNLMD